MAVALKERLLGTRQTVRDFLRQNHVVPVAEDYRRFVIVGMGRTGSNYLASSLRSRPGIKAFGEIFNQTDPARILWESDERVSTARQVDLRQREPVDFLNRFVFGPKPLNTEAVGFKLFYYHAREPHQLPVWDRLRDMRVHVIHLRRHNLLEQYLSMLDAESTGEWGRTSASNQRLAPVHRVDPEACCRAFEEVGRWVAEFRRFFAGQPVLEILYEDLITRYRQQMDRVQVFLGLAPLSTSSEMIKQNDRPLHQRIENFVELRSALRGTPWETFLG